MTPLLALLLCHDHFFAKSGIAAPQKHPLRQCIEKHKSRLQSEFTRARLRLRCGSLLELKKALDASRPASAQNHPRWARVNTVIAKDTENVLQNLPGVQSRDTLQDVLDSTGKSLSYCKDKHIPNLFAFSPALDLTKTTAYGSGEIILQDKASCFPAYLLLGDEKEAEIGDVLDGCAAPGNKTTHLASILSSMKTPRTIFACERDKTRSKILVSMTQKAGAGKIIKVLEKQDFLALDVGDERFQNVTHLLLDPSCSGSGILRREDIPKLALPEARQSQKPNTKDTKNLNGSSKKRKRDEPDDAVTELLDVNAEMEEERPDTEASTERLLKLSNLQTRIVEHAMAFPAARRVTYSTCSIHEQENEIVVSRLLASNVARSRGWKTMLRSEQVSGMKSWNHRGVRSGLHDENTLTPEELDACIRCSPDDGEGTMGFFVCAFVRSPSKSEQSNSNNDDQDAWEGFD